jgi:hypothetical protein
MPTWPVVPCGHTVPALPMFCLGSILKAPAYLGAAVEKDSKIIPALCLVSTALNDVPRAGAAGTLACTLADLNLGGLKQHIDSR